LVGIHHSLSASALVLWVALAVLLSFARRGPTHADARGKSVP
jgi:hypothetical protein